MLEAKNLTRRYEEIKGKSKTVLSDVNLTFPDKGLVAILGPSGSGKTTLLRLLGLLDEADEGSIIIDGEDSSKWSGRQTDDFRYENVGSIFQDYNLIPHLTVKENIALPFLIRNQEREGRVEEYLKRFQLEEVANSLPREISGGEAQRASVARAIILGQKILLCDEPTAALDEENATIIMDCLKEASRENLVILVTHNDVIAREYADYVVRLKKGKVVESNLPENAAKTDLLPKKHSKSRLSSLFSIPLKRALRFKRQYALLTLTSLVGLLAVSIVIGLTFGVKGILQGVETEMLQSTPITVERTYVDLMNRSWNNGGNVYNNDGLIHPLQKEATLYHLNAIDQTYVDYVKAGIPSDELSFLYGGGQPVITIDANSKPVVFSAGGQESIVELLTSTTRSAYQGALRPMELDERFFHDHFEAVEGRYPQNENEAYLLVSRGSEVDGAVAQALGKGQEAFPYADAIGKKFAFLTNDDYYVKLSGGTSVTGKFLLDENTLEGQGKRSSAIMTLLTEIIACDETGDIEKARALSKEVSSYFETEKSTHDLSYFMAVRSETELKKLYDNAPIENTVKVVGIFRPKENKILNEIQNGIYYSPTLSQRLLAINQTSQIAQEMRFHLTYDPISAFSMPTVYEIINSCKQSGTSMTEIASSIYNFFENEAKIGIDKVPTAIHIRPANLDEARKIREYLLRFNEGKTVERQIFFNDLVYIYGNLIDTYSILFYAVMYCICAVVTLTCGLTTLLTARLEIEKRRREISIYRSLGASKGFVAGLFLLEFFWIGLFAGIFGIALGYAFMPLINLIIRNASTSMYLATTATLPGWAALIILGVGILVSLLASFLPAFLSSRKPPSEHLKEQ